MLKKNIVFADFVSENDIFYIITNIMNLVKNIITDCSLDK